MTPEDLLRLAHVIGATVLFGTGAGIAFFMVMARRTANPALIAHVSGTVVIADTIFTATAAIIQPVTGYFLARIIGWPLSEGWIALSLCLYVFTGIFWLPVVWIQIKMKRLAETALSSDQPLPALYWTYDKWWTGLGCLAFPAVVVIFWLMVAMPG